MRADRRVHRQRPDDFPPSAGTARGRADRLPAARHLGLLLDRPGQPRRPLATAGRFRRPRALGSLVNTALARRASAEFAGTGLLVAAVVGSGIAAARLSPHDVGLQLLENAIA